MTTPDLNALLQDLLADQHDTLSAEQRQRLLAAAHDASERYSKAEQGPLRDTAIMAAYRIITGDLTVVTENQHRLIRARAAEAEALAALRAAAEAVEDLGEMSEREFARRAGVDRMAVRGWKGKR